MKHIHIAGERHEYCGWPAIGRAGDGSIIVSYCSSEEHVGPDGAIRVVRSTDEGETWSSPIVVRDSLLDDRECGMTVLSDGRILLHIWTTFHTPQTYSAMREFSYEQDVVDHWKLHVASREYASSSAEAGGWTYMSEDAGLSWSCIGHGPDTIHGGIELDTGEILVAGYRTQAPDVGIYRAGRDLDFRMIAKFETPKRADRRFGEPHIAQLPSGRIIMMLRSTAVPYDDESEGNVLWLTYSDDGGTTWAEARPTELFGFPPHLLVLGDGRVLCSYGRRHRPFGERACLSEDGMTWEKENEIIMRDDADSIDLGYPATIELGSGRLLSVYYQSPHTDPPAEMRPPDPMRHKPDIVGTIWNINEIG